jgi:DnaJ-class molecular chaperone
MNKINLPIEYIICDRCKGSGLVEAWKICSMIDYIRCPQCKGEGKIIKNG